MAKIATKDRHSRAIVSPPISAFLRLLVDPEHDASLKRFLKKYSAPDQQCKLLRVLQDVKFSHDLRTEQAHRISQARPWFNKRDRWRARVSKLDQDLETLLVEFQCTIYPQLRASNSLHEGYSREVGRTFEAIAQLQKSIEANPLLTQAFTTRGHQAEPYLKAAATAMHSLKISGADTIELLSMIGVKPDSFA